MKSSNKKGVQLLVQQCIAHGMRKIVFSPGSRNAPFIIAFDEHDETECIVIHDERSAAFFAMGMAQQLEEPVGIVCTSGSAVLNYYPAVAEAYYQSVPLVVITADRPQEWVDQGDGQTIVQHDVFKNHIRYSKTFSEFVPTESVQWFLEREISVAFSLGNGNWKGPIHFNMGLSEPLYQTEEALPLQNRIIKNITSEFQLSTTATTQIMDIWRGSAKKMVICGQMNDNPALLKQLIELSDDTSVAVLVENTSNLKHKSFVHCIDRTLNVIKEEQLKDFAPDLLVSMGGAVVSKRIKAFLRKYKPTYHFKVGYEFPYMDTYQSLTHTFECKPQSFIEMLNQRNVSKNGTMYGSRWKQKDYMLQDKLSGFMQRLPFSDLKVFEVLLDFLPEDSFLHMANSSVVRYCQLFDPVQSVRYWSNRGTSGIDGSTSTAAGIAFVKKDACNVLITGDVSFFYDSNALWNQHLTPNLRILLINNSGGGIFKIIPGPGKTNQLAKYFVAEHTYSAEYLCKAFDIEYLRAENLEQIEEQMSGFYEYEPNGRPKLMEIMTPSETNHEFLNEFWELGLKSEFY